MKNPIVEIIIKIIAMITIVLTFLLYGYVFVN